MQSIPYVLEVGDQEVVLTPDPTHEFTATTEQVALGYGVSADNIRKHKETKAEELIEGKHFLTVSNTHAQPGRGAQSQTLWTKRGIVRLGFFIRSARARLFRDMAEDLVIGQMQAAQPAAGEFINAHGVAAGLGCSRQSAQNRLSHARIQPVAHYVDVCPGYLYALADVQARWPAVRFEPFQGEARPGLEAVAVSVAAKAQTLAAKQQQSRLLSTDSLSLARELVQVETRRAEILAALGGAA